MSFVLRSLLRSLPRNAPSISNPILSHAAFPASSLVLSCHSLTSSSLRGAFLGGSVPVRFGSRKAGSVGTKTKSAVKKRFRVRGGGTLVRQAAGKRHLNIHKTRRHVNRLSACFFSCDDKAETNIILCEKWWWWWAIVIVHGIYFTHFCYPPPPPPLPSLKR